MRRVLFFFLFVLSLSFLGAVPMEFYLGGRFIAERDFISKETGGSFPTMNSNPEYYVGNISRLGGGIEMTYFPYAPIKLGLTAGYQMLFPIGYQLVSVSTGESGDVKTYVNYSYFAKHNITLALAYSLMTAESVGLYADAGALFVIHTIPDVSRPNNKGDVNYSSFSEYGVFGDLGVLLIHDDAYYKIGARFQGLLSHESPGISAAITVSGGYRFAF